MSIIENTWDFIAGRSWQTYGILYALLSFALTYFSAGNFWLGLFESVAIGASCFCFGASFHEKITTCACEGSETN